MLWAATTWLETCSCMADDWTSCSKFLLAGACVLTQVHFLSCEPLFDFDALLGPGELYLLRRRDILFSPHHAVVRLSDSTSSKKKASRKWWWLTAWLFFWRRKACKPLKPNDLLLQLPPLNWVLSNNVMHVSAAATLYPCFELVGYRQLGYRGRVAYTYLVSIWWWLGGFVAASSSDCDCNLNIRLWFSVCALAVSRWRVGEPN